MGRRQVEAIPVDSIEAVAAGPPGAFFIAEDRRTFYLRCPCGKCDKANALNLAKDRGGFTWKLKGKDKAPTLHPSIHWMNKDGRSTHWHGWLSDGRFSG